VDLGGESVEPLEQRVELPVADVLVLHAVILGARVKPESAVPQRAGRRVIRLARYTPTTTPTASIATS
jgi:hypothetical protein